MKLAQQKPKEELFYKLVLYHCANGNVAKVTVMF